MSTPDRTPEQPEPYTRLSPQIPLENEGWGQSTTDVPADENRQAPPQNPAESPDTVLPQDLEAAAVTPRKRNRKWWFIGSGAAAVSLLAASAAITLLVIADDSDTPDRMLDPDNWVDNESISEGIIAAGGSCDTLGSPHESTSTCANAIGTNYLIGYGEEASKDARLAAALAKTDQDKAVAWDDDWAIICMGTASSTDCGVLAEAFGTSKTVVDIDGDTGIYDSDSDLSSSGSSSSSSTSSGPATSFSDGTHMVGSDIEAGTYRNSGTTSCYWARLSGFSGTTDSILANANPDGQAIVTIEESDAAFQSQRCGTWEKIE